MVALLLAISVGTAVRFMPKLDYLPDGNANFLLARILVPLGYSIEESARIAENGTSGKATLGARRARW